MPRNILDDAFVAAQVNALKCSIASLCFNKYHIAFMALDELFVRIAREHTQMHGRRLPHKFSGFVAVLFHCLAIQGLARCV